MVRIGLSRSQVEQVLLQCLQQLSNGRSPTKIDPNAFVMIEWELDSEHGVELACDLSSRLGIEIPQEDNPLIADVNDNKRRARSFGEVVEYLMGLSAQ